MLKLTLIIVAIVTIFITALMLPPVIKICAVLLTVLGSGFYQLEADKSVIQKKE